MGHVFPYFEYIDIFNGYNSMSYVLISWPFIKAITLYF